jgi:hypothetical protein
MVKFGGIEWFEGIGRGGHGFGVCELLVGFEVVRQR